MNLSTFIIAAGLFAVVSFILYRQYKKAKSGESGCSCGCGGCPKASACQSQLPDKKTDQSV